MDEQLGKNFELYNYLFTAKIAHIGNWFYI